MSDTFRLEVLAVDDEAASLELLSAGLESDEIHVTAIQDPHEALRLVSTGRYGAVISDLMMPGMNGMELLQRIVQVDAGIEIILLTGNYSTESAVEAIQKGASDYLTKPVDLAQLRKKIQAVVDEAKRRKQAQRLDRELLNTFEFQGIIGRSPAMLDVFSKIRRIAPHFQTALVTGATGTGKELVARAMHVLGVGPAARFAVCNCSALVETLLESELFGHVKGAFTGAVQDRAGHFETAEGGTVFLDEIGELSLSAQAKLLRVIQNREITRVGSSSMRKVDVRVIGATHRQLADMVRSKTFREDLYYRLSMIEVRLPRLAERKEDLPLLQRHFVEHFSKQYKKNMAGLTRRAQAALARYNWPGNIRELENVIGQACMMATRDLIDVSDLDARIMTIQTAEDEEVMITADELVRRHAQKVLQKVDGNKALAAEILGISRSTLYRLLGDADKDARSAASAG
jgi:DNA-binding NtrC family response regulator